MVKFNKVTDRLYILKYKDYVFSLRYGDRGILSYGKGWFLKVITPYELSLACFCTKDDGHDCYKQSYGSKIWEDTEDIKLEALKVCSNVMGE